MKRSLANPETIGEVISRANEISETSRRRWGRMNSAQMLAHCDKIMQVGLRKVVLPEPNIIFKGIGICTKATMKTWNHGIPQNMPTFEAVKLKENCNFEKARTAFLATFEDFLVSMNQDALLSRHVLFGEMSQEDWAFLQYKHINHHFKQFGV